MIVAAIRWFVERIVGGIVSAFTFVHLWLWFVTPLGVRQITYAQAWGIDLIVTWLCIGAADMVAIGEKKIPKDSFLNALSITLIVLAFGWVVHRVMLLGY